MTMTAQEARDATVAARERRYKTSVESVFHQIKAATEEGLADVLTDEIHQRDIKDFMNELTSYGFVVRQHSFCGDHFQKLKVSW